MYFQLDQIAEPHSKFSFSHKVSEATAVNVLVPSEDEFHKELNDIFYINVVRCFDEQLVHFNYSLVLASNSWN